MTKNQEKRLFHVILVCIGMLIVAPIVPMIRPGPAVALSVFLVILGLAFVYIFGEE